MPQHQTHHSASVIITDARSGSSLDQARRMKRYAITMGFRTACFVGILFVPGIFKWILVAGAVFLPYIAVLFANQADSRTVAQRPAVDVQTEILPQLTTGQYETIDGSLADDESVTDDRAHRAA